MGQQEDTIALGAGAVDQRLQVGEEGADVQARLAGRGLVAPVGLQRQGKGEQPAQRGPAEGDDAGLRRRHARRSQPLLVEGRARDRILEAVVEAVDEDQQVAAGIRKVVNRALAESALRGVLDGGDRAHGVGRESGILHERRAVGDFGRARRGDDIVAVAGRRVGRARQQTVGREVDCRRHGIPRSCLRRL